MEHYTAESLGTLHEHEHSAETKELLEHRPSETAFIEAADTFGQLCDSTRLKILWLLAHSEECVSNIAVFIDMSAPAVSHHLRATPSPWVWTAEMKKPSPLRSRNSSRTICKQRKGRGCLIPGQPFAKFPPNLRRPMPSP